MLSRFITFFALLVLSCASAPTGTDSSESGSPGEVRASILIAPGVDITQINYTIACTPTPAPSQVATGTWPVTADLVGRAKVNGTIGGLDLNSTCTIVLTAQDTWGLDHGNIQNCRGEVDGLQPTGTAIQMNMTCIDNSVVGPNPGSITADIRVSQGPPYQCSGIAWYSSVESSSSIQGAGNAFTLNMGVTVPTSPQTVTWTSNDSAAVWYQGETIAVHSFNLTGNPATDPSTSGPSAQVMLCYNSGGLFTMTLTVQDLTPGLLINGQPGLCPAFSNTFQVGCY